MTTSGLPDSRSISPWLALMVAKSKRAARLLRETDATVAEVGSRVAYTSEFAFNRAFCCYHGISPGR